MHATMSGVAAVLVLAGFAFAGEHPEHPKPKAPAAATPAASAGMLDGKEFAGDLGKKGEQKGDHDEFVFKQGSFVSTACVKHGFTAAPYVATEQGGLVSFTCEPKNADGETMSWRGAVKGDVIEGVAVHTAGGNATEYWFKGTLKSGAPAKSEHPEHPQ